MLSSSKAISRDSTLFLYSLGLNPSLTSFLSRFSCDQRLFFVDPDAVNSRGLGIFILCYFLSFQNGEDDREVGPILIYYIF